VLRRTPIPSLEGIQADFSTYPRRAAFGRSWPSNRFTSRRRSALGTRGCPPVPRPEALASRRHLTNTDEWLFSSSPRDYSAEAPSILASDGQDPEDHHLVRTLARSVRYPAPEGTRFRPLHVPWAARVFSHWAGNPTPFSRSLRTGRFGLWRSEYPRRSGGIH